MPGAGRGGRGLRRGLQARGRRPARGGPRGAARAEPALVYCSISGYGAEGPLSDVPGHDVNYRAYAAALPPDAVSPEADELPVADMAAATMAAFAITAACPKARSTGVGDRIDLGMADVLADWVGTVPEATQRSGAGPVPGYGVYPTKDGQKITLGVVSEDRLWAATCHALGISEHADVPFIERLGRIGELDGAVTEAVAKLTRAEAVRVLSEAGAPVAPLLSHAEMLALDHFAHRRVHEEGPVRTTVHPPLPGGPAPGWTSIAGRPGDVRRAEKSGGIAPPFWHACDVSPRAMSPVLVGRSAELEELEDALAAAPGAVLVGGEAGVGKTRLIREFAQRVGERARVLVGGCLELGTDGLPFAPFTAVLRALVREIGTEGVAALRAAAATTGGLARLLPEFGEPDARRRLRRGARPAVRAGARRCWSGSPSSGRSSWSSRTPTGPTGPPATCWPS